MNKTIGERIKHFRNRRDLSRKELAKDICDESTLLRIEKGKQEAKVLNIQRFCEKLEIPLSYIINPLEDTDIKYINHIKKLCREFVYYDDYEALQTLIDEVEKNQKALIEKEDVKKFMNWHKAILSHKKENNLLKAEEELRHLIPEGNLVSETNIGIANSLGLVYHALNKKEEAIALFNKALLSIDQLAIVEDKTLYVRVGYNYAHSLYNKESYDKVICVMHTVIYHIQSNHLAYMSGRLHHMLSIAYDKLNLLAEAEEYMAQAAQFFLAKSNMFYHVKALRALSEIQFKAGKRDEGLQTLNTVEKKLPYLSDTKNLPILIKEMKSVYMYQGT